VVCLLDVLFKSTLFLSPVAPLPLFSYLLTIWFNFCISTVSVLLVVNAADLLNLDTMSYSLSNIDLSAEIGAGLSLP